LLVGISSPRKEIFLNRHMARCGVRVAMGVGGAFDVVAGTIPCAPVWMQRAGLEWCFRMLQEPRRLAWRYLSTNSQFAWILGGEIIRHYGFAWARRQALPWAEFLAAA
jgi:N-acetylglucosaminyldiphosphoundecaprenol N-acetyl-beta-D-mannosaminyltransferase